jgi:hypothetical protein
VKASADVGKRGSANARGIQGYTYNGADTTITLDFNLHGSVGSNPSGYERNVLSTDIAVLTGSLFGWTQDFGTLLYESFGTTLVETKSVFISSGLDQNVSDSITFDVTDGLEFYVVAFMSASSANGFADASSTLSLQFQNDTGLSAAAVSAVPVPATVWLFGSGLIGLMGVARRKIKN